MADSDRIVEIIIETNDKTGGALGAVQSKLLAFDKVVLRTQERLQRMTKNTYQASTELIDRTTGGIRSLEAKLMQTTGMSLSMLGTAGIGYGVVNAFQSQMNFEK